MVNYFHNHGIDKMDIIRQYIDIAFADITDYIEFGTEEVVTKDGLVVKRAFSRLKVDMIEVHPGPIKEIMANGDDIKIKLHDKMKALDVLSRYIGSIMQEQYEQQYESLEILCEVLNSDINKLEDGSILEEDFYNKFKSVAKGKIAKKF